MAQVQEPDSFIQACLHYKKEEYSNALSLFDNILSENSQHIDSLCMKSMTLSKIGKFEDALSCCDKALEIEPNDLILLNNKGYFESILGNNEKAIETFDKILKREPENISVLYNKALCFSRLEKFEDSIREYNKILEIDSEHVDALYNKGNDLHKLGKYNEAMTAYEQVLKLNPNHNNAKNNQLLSESKSSEEVNPFGGYVSNIDDYDNKFEKLRQWLDAGRPDTKDFDKHAIDSSLIEHLPQENEEAFVVLSKAKEFIRNNISKLEIDDDPIDVKAMELAKAMSKFDFSSNKKSIPPQKNKRKKSSKTKKSHKSVIILVAFMALTGFIAIYDAYPEVIFSFNPSQLIDSLDMALQFDIPAQESISSTVSPILSPEIIESTYGGIEFEIVQIFNEKRLEIGRSQFISVPELDALALKHSMDMASRNRVDRALSTDGLPVTREYADKLSLCIANAEKYSESNTQTSALNVYSGSIPIDEFTAEKVVSEWIEKDVRETLLRGTLYSNVGTGVSVSSDGTVYVSQIYC